MLVSRILFCVLFAAAILPSAAEGGPLIIVPKTKNVSTGTSVKFSTTAGVAPLKYSVDPATLGTITQAGVFTAGKSANSGKVIVKDAKGASTEAMVTVTLPPVITPAIANVSSGGSMSFKATGVEPLKFEISGGDADGEIDENTGKYTAGRMDFDIRREQAEYFNRAATGSKNIIRVTDGAGGKSFATVHVVAPPVIEPVTASLRMGASMTFKASGGVAPLQFWVSENRSGGKIDLNSGIYTAGSSAGTDKISVIDATGEADYAQVNVNHPLVISPSIAKVAIGQRLKFSGTRGSTSTEFNNFKITDNKSGGTIFWSNGEYKAGNRGGVDIVRLEEGGDIVEATVTVKGPLVITPDRVTIVTGASGKFSAYGGDAPLTFSLADYPSGGTINGQTGVYTAGGSAGTDIVRVTDADGTWIAATVTVELGPPTISPDKVTVTTGGSQVFSVTGGVAPLKIGLGNVSSPSGGTFNATTGEYKAGRKEGTDEIWVQDKRGRAVRAFVTVTAPPDIKPKTASVMTGGTATFRATGGFAPLAYSVNPATLGTITTEGVFTAGATAGSGKVIVTDAVGGKSEATVTVAAPLSISPTSKGVTTGGKFGFAVIGGIPPFTYSANPASLGTVTKGAFPGIMLFQAAAIAGSGKVIVTDAKGAKSEASVTVTEPPAIAPATKSLATGGTATFTATGGLTPLAYSVNPATLGTITPAGVFTAGATAGSCKVIVTDANGAKSEALVTLSPPPVIAPTSRGVTTRGTATFTATGGLAPLAYSVNPATLGTITPAGVFTAASTAGSGRVIVTDANGAKSEASVTLSPPPVIAPTTKSVTTGGTATFTATGGLAPLAYSVNPVTLGTITSAGVFKAASTAGSGTVIVTDANGAKSEATVTLSTPPVIAPTTKSVSPRGTATFTATGGVAPLAYSVNPATLGTITSAGVFTAGSTAGSGRVIVTDANGGLSEATVRVPAPLVLSPTTSSVTTGGAARIWASGGLAPLVYSVNPATLGTITPEGVFTAGSTAGSGRVIVTDANGASSEAPMTVTVKVTSPLVIAPTSASVSQKGTVSFTVSGGVSRATWAYSTKLGSVDRPKMRNYFTDGDVEGEYVTYVAGEAAGQGEVRVTDASGAMCVATIYIPPLLAISPKLGQVTKPGTPIKFTATGGVPPMKYSLTKNFSNGRIDPVSGVYVPGPEEGNGITAGVDVVRVTDAIGAFIEATVIVKRTLLISPLRVFVATGVSKTFSVTGGVAPLKFSIVENKSNGSIDGKTGLYKAGGSAGQDVIAVTDAVGSISTATVTVTPAPVISPVSANVPPGVSKSFSATGGVLPLTFSVSTNGSGASIDGKTGVYKAGNRSGADVVRVTDAAGGISDAAVTVKSTLEIFPAGSILTTGFSEKFTAYGGIAPLTLSLAKNKSGASFDGRTGVYKAGVPKWKAGDPDWDVDVIRVTDASGNIYDANVRVLPPKTGFDGEVIDNASSSNPLRPTIDPTSIDVTVNGSVKFSATSNLSPPAYSQAVTFKLVESQSGGSIDPSSGYYKAGGRAGRDVVRVMDQLGREGQAIVTVSLPPVISPTSATVISGASKTFSVTGGRVPLKFSIVENKSNGSIDAITGVYTAGNIPGVQDKICVEEPIVVSSDFISSTTLGGKSFATVTVAKPLVIEPRTATLSRGSTLKFTTVGGDPGPLNFSFVSNNSGGSLDELSGTYTPGSMAGVDVIRVLRNVASMTPMDYRGANEATITVVQPLVISPKTATIASGATQTFSATGGVAPLTFSLTSSKSGGSIDGKTGVYKAGSSAGADVVRVTDANGHTAEAVITVTHPPSVSPKTANASAGGARKFSATGGVAPLTFSLAVNKSGGSIDGKTGAYKAGSTAGADVVRATDALGSIGEATVTVTLPPSISPTTANVTTGTSRQFSATGGGAPLTFSITTNRSGGSIDDKTGVYKAGRRAEADIVRVKDAVGRFSDATVTVTYAPIIAPKTAKVTAGVSREFSTTGGVAPLTYSLFSNKSGGSIDSKTGVYKVGERAGVDIVRVTDAVGVMSDATVTVTLAPTITPKTANVAAGASRTFTATGGVAPLTYSLTANNSGGSIDGKMGAYIAGSSAGADVVRVTDAGGGVSEAAITVTLPPVISPKIANVAAGTPRSFTATDGVAPLTYSITANKSGGSIDGRTGAYRAGSSAGVDVVRVTDAVGGISDATVTVTLALSITPKTVNIAAGTSMAITATGGVAPLTYSVAPTGLGSITTEGAFTAGSKAGEGKVVVTDAGGAAVEVKVIVGNAKPLVISPTTKSLSGASMTTFTASGGVVPLVFSISPSSLGTITSTGDFTAASASGEGKVIVTDGSGAKAEAAVIVTPAPAPLIRRTSPASDATLTTTTPSFAWDAVSAVSYVIYISPAPFSVNTVILKATTSDARYDFQTIDATTQLLDGRTYHWTVLARDASGKVISEVKAGDYSAFTVKLPTTTTETIAIATSQDSFALSLVKLNDKSIDNLDAEWSLDRTSAPDGTLTVTGTIADAAWIRTLSISGDEGATYAAVELDAATGKFKYVFKLTQTKDFEFKMKVDLTNDQSVTKDISSSFRVLHYTHVTLEDQFKTMLTSLSDAFLQADRTKLMKLIDRDYVSTEQGFRDYTELENSIREQFQRLKTTTARYSSIELTIVVPDQQYILSFNWMQDITSTKFNTTRQVNATARLDVRKIDGVWLIREDKDRIIFVQDFGLIPGPPS